MYTLGKLRNWMMQENLDYFLVSSTDEYLNEYIPLSQNSRYLVTNFSGSTGDVLVGKEDACLFVDGRYHQQADEEVNHDIINIVKLDINKPQRKAIIEKLKDKGKIRLGLASSKTSYYAFCAIEKELSDIEFVEFGDDIVLEFKGAVKSKKNSRLKPLKQNISGMSADEKLKRVQENLEEDIFIVTKLDEVAYLTNCRNYDMAYSSCFKAKAIIDKEKCVIFTNHQTGKIGDNFEVREEKEFFEYLKKPQKTLVSTTSLNLKTFRALEHHQLKEVKVSPIAKMKAIKNKFEIKHYKRCFEKTDKVVARVQKWLSKNPESTERDLSKKVEKSFKRFKTRGLSFKTISATGEHSAIVHYSHPSDKLVKEGMVLLDCGAYFEGGYATDITQTFFIGDNPSSEQKNVYTAVLKGFLAGLKFNLSANSTGQDIDKAVREKVEEHAPEGFKFSHSTGHGVGICVHEGPPFISSSEWGKDTLQPGMCFTIEPGLYKDGAFGVRIERVVYIDESYRIIPLSKLPFNEKLINKDMLSDKEIEWVRTWRK